MSYPLFIVLSSPYCPGLPRRHAHFRRGPAYTRPRMFISIVELARTALQLLTVWLGSGQSPRLRNPRMPNGLDPISEPPSSIDSELVARVARGDRQAETAFVRRHQRAVTLVLQTRVQPDRVYDLTQETFIVVIARMRINDIHDANRIGGFLRQTAINLANGDRRKYARQRTDNDNEGIGIVVDDAMGPSDSVELHELLAMIAELMDELPMERDRDLLRRYLVQDQAKPSLCRHYGLSSEHFDRVLHRARVRLKELLDKRRGGH